MRIIPRLTQVLLLAFSTSPATVCAAEDQTVKYLRYQNGPEVSYGILEGETIHQLRGDLFQEPDRTGKTVELSRVRVLTPVEPSKVIAVGLNYKSHIGEASPAKYPGLFSKFPSSLVADGENILIPPDASNLHYEGEMVVVIGKTAKNVDRESARDYVFGITIGNDVSERAWQRGDLQWFRAKASDTFGPLGPWIVTGLNYNDLLLETRVNGELRQSSRTSLLIFDVPTIVSYVSHYVTLQPGDVIYTGTPGVTRAFQSGDLIEVSLEGVGVLKNRAMAE